MSFETIQLAVADGVARLTLARPEAANSIDIRLARDLLKAVVACESDRAVRAVLLTGTGRFFSAGGDLKSFAAQDDLPAHLREVTAHLHAALSHLARMPEPVVIAVNGPAAGAGFSLAVAGDLVLAARSASFTMAYTAAGLSPDGSASHFLPRLIGLRRTQELMLTNRRLSAEEACAWGLVTRVVDDEALAGEAEALVRSLAAGPTRAYGAVKRLLTDTLSTPLETQMELETRLISKLAASADAREGIAAFLAKRPARFGGS